MRQNPPMSLESLRMASPVGELRIVVSGAGVVAILWANERKLRVRFSEELEPVDRPSAVCAQAVEQLSQYFDGSRQEFTLPLDLRGTPFQITVWRALATIPYGQMASYKQQAQRIGSPTAVRAVGAANGCNPLSIVLPCHRVIGSDGSLTGFAGGLDAKRALLEFELRVSMGDQTPMAPVTPLRGGRVRQRGGQPGFPTPTCPRSGVEDFDPEALVALTLRLGLVDSDAPDLTR